MTAKIPARAITRPNPRTLEVLSGRLGLFNQREEPFAMERLPFRLSRETLEEPGVDEALEILAELAPAGANWLAVHLLDLGEGRGVWKVRARFWEPTRSRRLAAEPLIERSTDVFYATWGLPRMPDGMHRITDRSHRASLLRRRRR